MGEHQQNYYVREKALKKYIDTKSIYLAVSGGTWGVTVNIHDLHWKLGAQRLPVIYIAFNFPYKKRSIPIHLRYGRSRF